MSFIPLQWNSDYETGVEEIDLQHRYFLRLINRLATDLTANDDETYHHRLIDELYKYAAFHFLSEENIMFKCGYPALEEHRQHHFALLDKLSSRGNRPPAELLGFLSEWFVKHTAQEDHLIGEFIRTNSP